MRVLREVCLSMNEELRELNKKLHMMELKLGLVGETLTIIEEKIKRIKATLGIE